MSLSNPSTPPRMWELATYSFGRSVGHFVRIVMFAQGILLWFYGFCYFVGVWHWPVLLASTFSLFLCYGSFIFCSIPALLGAVQDQHWSYLAAISTFFWPLPVYIFLLIFWTMRR